MSTNESTNKSTPMHWADQVANRIISQKGEKKRYVCASGISPSGKVHIGNFREIITSELVVRALKDKGKKVRFIYSWDDYDRFRKVPAGVPTEFEKYIGMPYSDIPDPFGCHESYALHFEKELEEGIKPLGVEVEYIRQSIKYKNCDYAELIKKALINRKKIIEILNKYREELLPADYIPLNVYCEKCKKDSTTVVYYDEEFTVEYTCECGHKDTIDFRKKGIVKLPWRVDWPMRWSYECVDFEPGGKDHSTVGGSRTTGEEIAKEVYGIDAPIYQVYDFIRIKGGPGKMSGSAGGAFSPAEVMEIYEPEVVRYFFVGSRPGSEFAISFDLDAIKNYEDFDKCERIYFGEHKVDEKETEKQKRIYELSFINKLPKNMPHQFSFRHLTNVLQAYEGQIGEAFAYYKKEGEFKTKFEEERFKTRATCALNWLKEYAPDDMKFTIQKVIPVHLKIGEKQKQALKIIANELKSKEWNEETLFNEFYEICKKLELDVKDFFKAAYLVLIEKERGPKLASFILTIGKERVAELFEKV